MNKDKEFKKWLKSRPKVIQELAKKYPPDLYVIEEGAPYGISCAGTLVYVAGWTESGDVFIHIKAEDKRPEAIVHEKMLGKKHGKSKEEMEVIHNQDIRTQIDPKWLLSKSKLKTDG